MRMQDKILKFSNEELDILVDRNFFNLKHTATEKMKDLFGKLEVEVKVIFKASNIEVDGINNSSGKIFRGENYQSYPYVLLDCPRLFNTQTVFAFRSMFWWGNEFTFTLHLQGNAWTKFKVPLIKNLKSLKGKNVFICVNDNPWQYHLKKDNYIELDSIIDDKNKVQEIIDSNFVKLTRTLPISEYEKVIEIGKETLEIFLTALRN